MGHFRWYSRNSHYASIHDWFLSLMTFYLMECLELMTLTFFPCSKETAPPGNLPQNGELPYTVRNYTIVGNYKIGFPQWRLMRCTYPESGPPLLRAGDEVYVLGRSQKRGYLVVELNGQQMHLPHNYTELRVCSILLGERVMGTSDTDLVKGLWFQILSSLC